MEIKEAQREVDKKIQEYGGYWEPLSMLARLTEEVGELARAMNQKYGGKRKKFEGDGKDIEEEISDVFFDLLCICNSLGIDLEEEFKRKTEKSHQTYKEVYSNGK